MGRKKLLITFLFSIVILTLTFIPVSTQQSAGDYDPWNDINEDGKIDIYDVASTALKFGTSGDPAKNVTIAGYATTEDSLYKTIDPKTNWYVYIDTRGYRKISVGLDIVGTAVLNVNIFWRVGGWAYVWQSFTLSDTELRVYDVNGAEMDIGIYNPDTVAHTVYLDYYLTA